MHARAMWASKDGGTGPAKAEPEKAGVLKYGAGYFHKSRNEMTVCLCRWRIDAGADVERGVYAAGLIYEKGGFSIGAIDYLCDDIINIAYAEAKMEIPLGGLVAEAQWPVRATAQCRGEPPSGSSFSAQQFGLKARSACDEGAIFTAAALMPRGMPPCGTPWSGYPGYTSVQVQDFFRRG